MANGDIPLSEAIAAVRRELTLALAAGKTEDIHFKVGPVELEFTVDAKREVGGGGGVKLYFVSLEGKGGGTDSHGNRIKVTLQPELRARSGANEHLR
jgi:hypothetical protein